MVESSGDLGFKRLSISNWRDPDDVLAHFVHLPTSADAARRVAGDEWAAAILSVPIDVGVPADIQTLLETSRGAMLYGWFFYPLFSVGMEQALRTIEAAVKDHCEAIDIRGSMGFSKRLDELEKAGLIDAVTRNDIWKIWELRNETTHPKFQSILPPGVSIQILATVIGLVN